jgi:hypothetical protein
MRKVWVPAIAAGLLAASGGMAPAQNATVESISVQLFYEYDGTLSDDLAKRKDLSLRNVMIGEGDAKQPANSFLVAVTVKGAPEAFDKAAVLTITVTGDKRKNKVAEKVFNGILFGAEERVVKPVFVQDWVCAPATVTAKLKTGSSKSFQLPFQCGE